MPRQSPVRAAVVRHLAAPPERVYDAWLGTTMLGQWMFGPFLRDREEIVHLAVDPRVGGAFSFMVERDGEDLEFLGRFLELDRARRLAFTWTVAGEPVGSRVLVEIERAGDGAQLRVTQELHPSCADRVPPLEQEWGRRLEALALALAANHPSAPPRTGSG
jgi:uncharacterized protein YndB with AHSA1/START domain